MQTSTTPELKSFHFVFQLSKKIVFEVNYYRLGSNTNKYFTTSAASFNQPKTDYNQCGQAQDSLLSGKAKLFYKKWDYLHTLDVTKNQYNDILSDIEELKGTYNFIERESKSFCFSEIKEFSKLNIKK